MLESTVKRAVRWAASSSSRRPHRTAGVTVRPPADRRCLTCGRRIERQRLFWAGSVLDRVSPYLQEVPKDWIMSVGMGQDAEDGMTFTHIAGSVSHSLLAYRTAPGKGKQKAEERLLGDRVILTSGEEAPDVETDGFAKVLAVGRNTQGQLGLGFTSQESSWGMVSAGFEGRRIQRVVAGNGVSFVVMEQEDASSQLYAFGNNTSGQLGLGDTNHLRPASNPNESQQALVSSPTEVELPEIAGCKARIVEIAAGLDHVIVLSEAVGADVSGRLVYTCGLNTDGQLGVPSQETRFGSSTLKLVDPHHFDLSAEDELVGVSAGGDTSFAWSRTGRVWAWGNSEYGQAGHGKAMDRIDKPLEATASLKDAGVQGIRKIAAGGSFAVILDESGIVWTMGYGAIAQGIDRLQTLAPLKVHSFRASNLSNGLDYVAAVGEDGKLRTWGLDTMAGRLALDPPSRKPWPSFMIASRFTADASRTLGDRVPITSPSERPTTGRGMLQHHLPTEVHAKRGLLGVDIVDVTCSGETLWVLGEDGEEPKDVWNAPE